MAVVAVVVSGVTKGIMCNTPQDSRRHVNVHVHADSQYLRKVIQFRNNNCSICDEVRGRGVEEGRWGGGEEEWTRGRKEGEKGRREGEEKKNRRGEE